MSSKEYNELHKEENKARCHKYHAEHKDKENARSRAYFLTHRERLLKQMSIRQKVRHQENKEKENQIGREYYQKNKEKKLERTHNYQHKNASMISAQKSTRNKAAKADALTHYGNGKIACVKCGFNDIRALSIDHIDGSGADKRKERRSTGVNLYGWLKRNNYPEGFQTLCMNCQAEKKILNREQTRGTPLNPKYVSQRNYQKQLKFDAINKYSNGQLTCMKCGYSSIEMLSIDHINGDGAQHKKERDIGSLYIWLRNNNYPDGYQTLCMNCQYIKRSENNEHTKQKEKERIKEVMSLV
jgi:hypothetical protein